jgi:DNA-binding PadR family transcriptional regulator
MVRPIDLDPERYLPLKPVTFAVLAALAEGPQPGIHILDAVNATSNRRRWLGPGTLYRLLRDLREAALITRATGVAAGDDRQSPHELTTLGRNVLNAELARVQRTMALAAGRLRPTDS